MSWIEPSPFLKRGVDRQARDLAAWHGDARQQRDAMERERGRITLEKLRYRRWVRRGTMGNFMQRLGDWARAHGFTRLPIR